MQMEIFTMENGSMIKPMDMELICIKMEQDMMAIGRTTCKMEKELKFGLMALNTKVIIKKA
jgi:hypothetical protein